MRCALLGLLLSQISLFAPGDSLRADDKDPSQWYTTKIAPIFKEKCVSCHGPVRQEAGLRLDTGAFVRKGSDEGSVTDVQKPELSKLLIRIRSTTPEERMPPEGEGVSLTHEQTDWIRQWIAEGIRAPDNETTLAGPNEHWAFQPIARPSRGFDNNDSVNPIDAILEPVQRSKGIVPLSPADPMTLLRRLSFDLTGLPPTPDEISSFSRNASRETFEKTIDLWMSRPSFGERWARHWMDVWRYSDWDGYKEELRGSQRNIWHWREWIVEALNENKPYDQMVLEMLAADELYPTDRRALRATGFLARNYHRSNRHIWLDATVEHTAKAFLGLTVNCSKCHDHKYDPISQADYYRFRAIFEPHQVRTDAAHSSADPELAAFPRAYDSDLNATTQFFIRGDDKHPDKSKVIVPGIPESIPIAVNFAVEPVQVPISSSYPELQPDAQHTAMKAAWKRADAAKNELNAAMESAKKADLDTLRNPGESTSRENVSIAVLKLRESQASIESIQRRIAADHAKYIQRNDALAAERAAEALKAEQSWKELDVEYRLESAKRSLRIAKEKQEIDADKKEADKKKSALTKAEKDLSVIAEEYKKLHAADGSGKLKAYTAFSKGYPETSSGRRAALARWITDKENPLTPRVAINHIWARHFGTPLAENVFDFGMKAPSPELLEVLNFLAAELVNHNWDMNHIHRLILRSKVYQRASSGSQDLFQSNRSMDPDNRYYWRFEVRRLDAEEVRDGVLFAGGLLDSSLGGPDISEDDGEKSMRRSLYFRHAYEKQMTMMLTFDAASPNECYRRKPSIIPQQALALANSSLTRKASTHVGTQVWSIEHATANSKVESLFLRTLSRPPTSEEQASCSEFLRQHGENEQTYQSLAHVLMNHNDFVSAR